ncbi:MAG: hypothetical protein ACFFBI_01485, partial [Promethearchaeota archaeon]
MIEREPPTCFICGKNCENSMEDTYYCICDIAICNDCINTVKRNDNTWICPHCKGENNLEESKLF